MSARVTLYGKPGCHLCDDARAVIERVCADLGESYDEISILDDPALPERFGEEIPVTFVDGRQHDFWRVDEERLRAALADARPVTGVRACRRLARSGARQFVPAPATYRPVAGRSRSRRFCSRVHKLLQ